MLPLEFILIFLSLGQISPFFLPFSTSQPTLIVLFLFTLFMILIYLVLGRLALFQRLKSILMLAILFLSAFTATAYCLQGKLEANLSIKNQGNYQLTGRILSFQSKTPFRHQLIVRPDWMFQTGNEKDPRLTHLPSKIQLSYYGKLENIQSGHRYRINARIKPIRTPYNFNLFDQERHYFFKQIQAIGTILSFEARLEPQDLSDHMSLWRSSLLRTLAQNARALFGHSGNINPLLPTLGWGSDQSVPSKTWGNARLLGVVHLLVISGFHLSVVIISIVLTIYHLLRRLGVQAFKAHQISLLFSIVISLFYVFLIGLEVPIMRALIMAIIFPAQSFKPQPNSKMDFISNRPQFGFMARA